MNLNTTGLFDLSHTLAGDYLARFTYPWQALDVIKDLILALGPTLGDEYEEMGSQIWVHQTAQIITAVTQITSVNRSIGFNFTRTTSCVPALHFAVFEIPDQVPDSDSGADDG